MSSLGPEAGHALTFNPDHSMGPNHPLAHSTKMRSKSMLSISEQIVWVYTHNLEETARFYTGKLGLTLVRDEGSARIFRVSPSSCIGVCVAFEDRIVEPGGGMITFVTEHIDEWHEALSANGVPIQKGPHVLEAFNVYTFFTKDPNGYIIEFQQFL